MADSITAPRAHAADEAPAGIAVRVTATVGALVTVVLVLTTLLVWVGRGFDALPVSFGSTVLGAVGLVASSICYAVVGALLAVRVPRNPIGWLFLATGFALGSMLPINLLVAGASEALRPADPLLVLIAWARTTFATPLVLTLLLIAGYLFPDGRPLTPRWWGGVAVSILGGVLLATVTAVNPEGLVTYPSIPNPLATPPSLGRLVRIGAVVAIATILLAIAFAVASLALRYRRGSRLLRVQLRWILLAVTITGLSAGPLLLFRYVMPVSDATGEFFAMVAQVGACAFPVAAAFAVTHYRLYDIDTLIGKTLVYVPLTGILAGLYAASITLLQRLFVAVTGGQSDLAIVLTALVLAAGFTPLRTGLEAMVARRLGTDAARTTPDSGADGPAAIDPQPATTATDAPDPLRAPLVTMLRPDAAGAVACPRLGEGVPVARCLSCRYLTAVVRAPEPAVLCSARGPAAAR